MSGQSDVNHSPRTYVPYVNKPDLREREAGSRFQESSRTPKEDRSSRRFPADKDLLFWSLECIALEGKDLRGFPTVDHVT